MLEIDGINKRLSEIPAQLEQIMAERNQLLGYKKALEDAETAKENSNGKIKKIGEK